MQCFSFYSPNKFNPIGRIPPDESIYTGISIDPKLAILYKKSVLDSVNANTYTQNQLYSYVANNPMKYRCINFK